MWTKERAGHVCLWASGIVQWAAHSLRDPAAGQWLVHLAPTTGDAPYALSFPATNLRQMHHWMLRHCAVCSAMGRAPFNNSAPLGQGGLGGGGGGSHTTHTAPLLLERLGQIFLRAFG